VVDNDSPDNTAALARHMGVAVVEVPVRGIRRARNRGAVESRGDTPVFVGADVTVPPTLLSTIERQLAHQDCVGGGFGALEMALIPWIGSRACESIRHR